MILKSRVLFGSNNPSFRKELGVAFRGMWNKSIGLGVQGHIY